jgi:hypothetical protein
MIRIVNYIYNFSFQCLYKKAPELVTLVALVCIYRFVTRSPTLKKPKTPAEVYHKSCLSHPVRGKNPSPKSVRFAQSCQAANSFISRLFPEGVREENLPALNQIFREIEEPDWVVRTINKLVRSPDAKIQILRLFAYYNNPKQIMSEVRGRLCDLNAPFLADWDKVALISEICRRQLPKSR